MVRKSYGKKVKSFLGVLSDFLFCLVQALLLCAPLFGLIMTQPPVFVVVVSIMIFVTAMATLVLIFVPKILFTEKKQRESVHMNDKGNTSLAVIKMRAGHESKSTKMMNFIESSMHENTNKSSLIKGNEPSANVYRRSTSLPEGDTSEMNEKKSRLETIESVRLLQQKVVSIDDSSEATNEAYGTTFVNTTRNLYSRNASSICSSVENIIEEQNEVEGYYQDVKKECGDDEIKDGDSG